MNDDFKLLDLNDTIEAFAEGVRPDAVLPYKRVGEVTLHAHVFRAASEVPTPVVVFFFGGGWLDGSPSQFYPQAVQLRARGLTCVCAEYRVFKKHQTSGFECIKDARSVIRWVRAQARELNIRPDRVVASGGSAGGHLAVCAAMISEFDEATDDLDLSPTPNLLALFNPVLVVEESSLALERFRPEPAKASPQKHVRPGLPPTLIMTGTADTLTTIGAARAFTEAMVAAGNTCKLVPYEGQVHAFFNYGHGGDHACFKATMHDMEAFLSEHDYL